MLMFHIAILASPYAVWTRFTAPYIDAGGRTATHETYGDARRRRRTVRSHADCVDVCKAEASNARSSNLMHTTSRVKFQPYHWPLPAYVVLRAAGKFRLTPAINWGGCWLGWVQIKNACWKVLQSPVTVWPYIQAFQMTVAERIIASALLSNAQHVSLLFGLYRRGNMRACSISWDLWAMRYRKVDKSAIHIAISHNRYEPNIYILFNLISGISDHTSFSSHISQ